MHRAVLTQEHEFHMVNGKLFITSETDPDKQVALSVKERVGNIRLVETGKQITKKAQWMIGRTTNVGYDSQAHRAKKRIRKGVNIRPTGPKTVAQTTHDRDSKCMYRLHTVQVDVCLLHMTRVYTRYES